MEHSLSIRGGCTDIYVSISKQFHWAVDESISALCPYFLFFTVGQPSSEPFQEAKARYLIRWKLHWCITHIWLYHHVMSIFQDLISQNK